MKILQVFNRYRERGGEEISVERISNVLSRRHEVFHCYFDSATWTENPDPGESLKQAMLMIHNPASIRRLMVQIDACKPDLILLHNVFPVGSMGVFRAILDRGIPVFHFVHNFRPYSVNGYLWAGDKLLDQGLSLNFVPEILAASWQNSRLKTAVYAGVLWMMHGLGIFKRVDAWLAISSFVREVFVKAGLEQSKVHLLRHSWDPVNHAADPAPPPPADGPYLLFLGRLTEAKGVTTLLEAWRHAAAVLPDTRLLIGGSGPLEDRVREEASSLPRCDYLGQVGGSHKDALLAHCSAVVIPSVWWEALGLVAYEAYDYAKPVLAARSGGLAECVTPGETGWIHEPGDARELARHMAEVIGDPGEAVRRGQAGRAWLLAHTGCENWLDEFERIATLTMARKAAAAPTGTMRLPARPDTGTTAPAAQAVRNLAISVYLADQNPRFDRSFGISRMTEVVLRSITRFDPVSMRAIVSKSSKQAPDAAHRTRVLPWGTRSKWARFLTDHLHPLICASPGEFDLFYYPKGYLPFLWSKCSPSVVTIHDTIIQYDEDHYPQWRRRSEYTYWSNMLKHTLRRADRIMTVSQSSRRQIEVFMERHGIPPKEITVTYEPCHYEDIPQPWQPEKEDFVMHLASCEPHKRTSHLVRWWTEAEQDGALLPTLHLIGRAPDDVEALAASSDRILRRPFLDDGELQLAYRRAKALILPSEIEGFGLPALEAYYLGTPVCYVRDTSVGEVLSVATPKGGFSLDDRDSLFAALDEVLAMPPDQIHECGLVLRETYSAAKVARRMMEVFRSVAS